MTQHAIFYVSLLILKRERDVKKVYVCCAQERPLSLLIFLLNDLFVLAAVLPLGHS